MQVILPADKLAANGSYAVQKPFRTLYLLHGLHGNHADWNANTRIRRWAQDQGLAVVMPAGDNAFYVDQPLSGNNYGIFVGQELVEITRAMFPLSHKREDTFLGGLSMGGFGALRNGLKYHDTFGAVVSLSGALRVFDGVEERIAAGEDFAFESTLFGPVRQAMASDKNPEVLMKQLAQEKKKNPQLALPDIYIACGTEDGLLPSNRLCRKQLEELGFCVTYEEAPGGHEWDFWDSQIHKVLQWLPLAKASQGLNSGNVGK
jgi:S-formylglutathione hydrolase FrmB